MNSSAIVSKASSVARRLRRLSSSTTSLIGSSSLVGAGSSSSNLPISTTLMESPAMNATTTIPQRRRMGSGGGTRGARGHGWWVNYRAGKGGRHLQGTYSHLDLDAMAEWNDAVFGLGSTLAYVDVKLESLAGMDEETEANAEQQIQRLTLELATEALPLATENFLKLLVAEDNGYHSTTLHRIEKGVGILGGLVADNPNYQSLNPNAPTTKKKMGMCHPDLGMNTSPTAMDISKEHLVVNHLEGVVTMLQPRIGEIDSRFLVLGGNAPHLDGVSVAVGRLANPESLQAIQTWESTLITSHGVPTNAVLKIVGCGVLEEAKSSSSTEEAAAPQQASQ
mmetsp:Transcript_21309/g.43832  ORF Transcript_21309/g.43832 Transcript_21309/m.43832 type:complete len:337 (+) Transcript_21309:127-1137(+)|eukprot:CAMPEP_0197271500 /NCGR_PEP_ID=MMETSP1432-20130617/8618_1 /TAXON_ID=44447 /ORGANISM="Pseudo-nitzschia delicatissima, Strain UNC1205" /LENGTH=336 /DNA_ID=CAMNT_0042736919 /DNA_START=119 /DNA_END=1129 /DNA_ORIENTATION=-